MYKTLKGRGAVEKITMYLEKFDFLQWVSHAFLLLKPVSVTEENLHPLVVIPEQNQHNVLHIPSGFSPICAHISVKKP